MTTSDTYTANYGLVKAAFANTTWHDKVNGNFDKLDAMLALALTNLNVDSTWLVSTAYVAEDRVYDPGTARLYRCLVAHTSAASGTFTADWLAHPTYWELIDIFSVWRGQWLTATSYKVGDTAYQAGSTYRCAVAHTSGVFATDLAAVKWELFASQGSTGAGSGDANGPAGAVSGNIATFANITGKLLADSGHALSEYAPISNPTFTGVPAAPTAVAGTNTTQLATTAFVQAAVTALINAAGAAYDTLGEIAAILVTKWDDAVIHALASKATAVDADEMSILDSVASFVGKKLTVLQFWTNYIKPKSDALYATITNLALKAPLASPTFTGTPDSTTPAADDNTTRIATTAYVQTEIANYMTIPTSSTLPIGTLVCASNNSASSIANGSTTAGSGLLRLGNGGSSAFNFGVALTGTWKNVSGATVNTGNCVGLWVRTA